MNINRKEKKALKSRAHHLKPVVRIGQKGLTEQVEQETSICLDTHELIKVHIHEGDREICMTQAQALACATQSELIHHIGKVFILYRPKEGVS